MNFIWPAANKSIPRIYDFCMILVLHFEPFMTKIMVQHKGDTFPIPTDLNYLTNHITLKLFPFILTNYSSMKLSSFLQTERNDITTTGTLTRVDYLRINK